MFFSKEPHHWLLIKAKSGLSNFFIGWKRHVFLASTPPNQSLLGPTLIYNNVFFNLIELGPICVLARYLLSRRVANYNLQENHCMSFMDAISDGHQRTIPYKCVNILGDAQQAEQYCKYYASATWWSAVGPQVWGICNYIGVHGRKLWGHDCQLGLEFAMNWVMATTNVLECLLSTSRMLEDCKYNASSIFCPLGILYMLSHQITFHGCVIIKKQRKPWQWEACPFQQQPPSSSACCQPHEKETVCICVSKSESNRIALSNF